MGRKPGSKPVRAQYPHHSRSSMMDPMEEKARPRHPSRKSMEEANRRGSGARVSRREQTERESDQMMMAPLQRRKRACHRPQIRRKSMEDAGKGWSKLLVPPKRREGESPVFLQEAAASVGFSLARRDWSSGDSLARRDWSGGCLGFVRVAIQTVKGLGDGQPYCALWVLPSSLIILGCLFNSQGLIVRTEMERLPY
ncbi:hypothetical protein Tsubulata_004509 [Turnera subulata]|uniref:Uncharacterized protein n=1 Tax=Turnera subulata TaxID=218843 RepID=A0A9Q0F1P8_9ROSI|nr:hypothetical protein Tsubulata_004509 [Turnera subulata]